MKTNWICKFPVRKILGRNCFMLCRVDLWDFSIHAAFTVCYFHDVFEILVSVINVVKTFTKDESIRRRSIKGWKKARGSLWITISSVGHSYYVHVYYQILNVLAICASYLTVKWIHVMETLIVLVSSCSLIEHVTPKVIIHLWNLVLKL